MQTAANFMKSIYDKIWESALRSIQARMMSKKELQRKLEQKYPEEGGTISQILDEMERVELLSDRRYAEQLINHLTQRPIGRLKIMVEIRKRGLDSDVVENLLLSSGYDEVEACKKALAEKEHTIREEDPRKRRQKIMNFLRNLGFKDAVIYSVLKNY